MSSTSRWDALGVAATGVFRSRDCARGVLACTSRIHHRDRRRAFLDVDSWQRALDAERAGLNPYETGVLNWPPFWLQIIALLKAVASYVDSSFWTALRVYLIVAESAVIVTLYFTLASVGADRDAVRRALLVGIALNPVAILLVCLHGNSDVNVGLLVTLAVAALIALSGIARHRLLAGWLLSSWNWRAGQDRTPRPRARSRAWCAAAGWAGGSLAAALFLGPAALGLSVITALAPDATRRT